RRRSMSTLSSSSFPASILEKSRRSLLMPSRFLPERCTVSAYLRCALVSPVSSNSSVIPRTPFIGVRISWLILARNELFAWLADSAASRARRSASSLRLCCVTSRATEMLHKRSEEALRLRLEEHTPELQSLAYLVWRLQLENKNSNWMVNSYIRFRLTESVT